jgi:CBS domain-containing protein
VPVGDALEPEAPLVLPRELPAIAALEQLVAAQGHCLLVSEGDQVVGLVTLPDLQRALTAASDDDTLANSPNPPPLALGECQRSELVWLPLQASLAQLEDQLRPSGLRQLPIFELGTGSVLPVGLPRLGLPLESLRGVASRDGLARALASRLIPSLADPLAAGQQA